MSTLKFQFVPANLRQTAAHLKRDAGVKFGKKSESEVEDFLVDEAVKLFLTRYGTRDLDPKAINCEGVSPANILYRGLLLGFSVSGEASGGTLREVEVPGTAPRKKGASFVSVEFWVLLG